MRVQSWPSIVVIWHCNSSVVLGTPCHGAAKNDKERKRKREERETSQRAQDLPLQRTGAGENHPVKGWLKVLLRIGIFNVKCFFFKLLLFCCIVCNPCLLHDPPTFSKISPLESWVRLSLLPPHWSTS